MFKDYSKYQISDYLSDDYFVDTMLEPTPESETFWKILIDDGKINVDEFISAYMTLKGLHKYKPEVSDEKVEALWRRIEKTNYSKNLRMKRFRLFRNLAVACSFVGIIGFSIFTFIKIGKVDSHQSITDFANENIIHTKQPTNQIQLISGNQSIAVEGTQAKLEYDENGKLKVNKQAVDIKSVQPIKGKATYNQLRVPYGKRAFLTLSDGSSLWINTGTTVIYPTTLQR